MRNPIVASLLPLALAACATTRAASPADSALHAAVAASDVVFVGESHDQKSHHDLELEVLAAAATTRPFLLGMEMFNQSAQPALDDYVAGRIDEREMLRRSAYYTHWSANHAEYARLWRWCRENGVRVVGLNVPRTITRKISREGFDALTPEEREQIAASIDLGVGAHREKVMAVFGGGAHAMPAAQIEGFYAAQTTWDETMADAAARALLAAGPGARMVVVAGRFHAEPEAIPDRLARRVPGLSRTIVLAATSEEAKGREVERDGDVFVVTFPPSPEPASPKLGVMLGGEGGLAVQSVVPGGPAANAGVAAGDVIVSLRGTSVADMTDFRFVLEQARLGDTVKLGVRRGAETKSLDVTLTPPPPPTAAPPAQQPAAPPPKP